MDVPPLPRPRIGDRIDVVIGGVWYRRVIVRDLAIGPWPVVRRGDVGMLPADAYVVVEGVQTWRPSEPKGS
jgi:hypothetical protein